MLALYQSGIEKIRNSINPFKDNWTNIDETNCYAYALGIDLTREEIYPFPNFNPGSFSGYCLGNPFSSSELLTCIEADLYNLGIEFKEVDVNYKLHDNEWLISTMMTSQFNYDESTDYHFVKYIELYNKLLGFKKGEWTHKKGCYAIPTGLDSRGKKIINPIVSPIETDGLFTSTKYEHLKTFCLKKRQF